MADNANMDPADAGKHSFAVICGIMYFASMVYVYNRHLKIFGYFILVFIFVVAWLFIAKDFGEYSKGFGNTKIYGFLKQNPYGTYIIYAIVGLGLLSVLLNSYGIGTVLKTYMDRIAQVKSYNLNLSQYQRDNLFIFNTGFYISSILLIGLIYSFSFFEKDENEKDKPITFNDFSYINIAQMCAFLFAIVASFLVADYSTRFKRAKYDKLPSQKESFESERKYIKDINLNDIATDSGDIWILNDNEYIIEENQRLKITAQQRLMINDSKQIINNGTIENNGTIIFRYGTIINEVTGTIANNSIFVIMERRSTENSMTNNGIIINNGNFYSNMRNHKSKYVERGFSVNEYDRDEFAFVSNDDITIKTSQTFIIPNDVKLCIKNKNNKINNFGKIKIIGTLENYGNINNNIGTISINKDGTFYNFGTVNNKGTMNDKCIIANEGIFYNTSIEISKNAIYYGKEYDALTYYAGTINNFGNFKGNGQFYNFSTINTNKKITDFFKINRGIINDSSVTKVPMENFAEKYNNYYHINSIPKDGIIRINKNQTLDISGTTLYFSSYSGRIGFAGNVMTFENHGTINIKEGAYFYIYDKLINTGKINNNGIISNVFEVKNDGVIVNNGTGTIKNYQYDQTDDNENSKTVDSILTNNNSIVNKGTISNDGTINNNGTINNEKGTINNDGTYSGKSPKPRGTITGIKLVN